VIAFDAYTKTAFEFLIRERIRTFLFKKMAYDAPHLYFFDLAAAQPTPADPLPASKKKILDGWFGPLTAEATQPREDEKSFEETLEGYYYNEKDTENKISKIMTKDAVLLSEIKDKDEAKDAGKEIQEEYFEALNRIMTKQEEYEKHYDSYRPSDFKYRPVGADSEIPAAQVTPMSQEVYYEFAKSVVPIWDEVDGWTNTKDLLDLAKEHFLVTGDPSAKQCNKLWYLYHSELKWIDNSYYDKYGDDDPPKYNDQRHSLHYWIKRELATDTPGIAYRIKYISEYKALNKKCVNNYINAEKDVKKAEADAKEILEVYRALAIKHSLPEIEPSTFISTLKIGDEVVIDEKDTGIIASPLNLYLVAAYLLTQDGDKTPVNPKVPNQSKRIELATKHLQKMFWEVFEENIKIIQGAVKDKEGFKKAESSIKTTYEKETKELRENSPVTKYFKSENLERTIDQALFNLIEPI
jgi:hypothetical protein